MRVAPWRVTPLTLSPSGRRREKFHIIFLISFLVYGRMSGSEWEWCQAGGGSTRGWRGFTWRTADSLVGLRCHGTAFAFTVAELMVRLLRWEGLAETVNIAMSVDGILTPATSEPAPVLGEERAGLAGWAGPAQGHDANETTLT